MKLFSFENTVVGQFFGHTHSEEFEVMYEDMNDPKSRPTGVIYSAPSLTPYSDYFPGYRVVTIDGSYSGSTFVSQMAEILSTPKTFSK